MTFLNTTAVKELFETETMIAGRLTCLACVFECDNIIYPFGIDPNVKFECPNCRSRNTIRE